MDEAVQAVHAMLKYIVSKDAFQELYQGVLYGIKSFFGGPKMSLPNYLTVEQVPGGLGVFAQRDFKIHETIIVALGTYIDIGKEQQTEEEQRYSYQLTGKKWEHIAVCFAEGHACNLVKYINSGLSKEGKGKGKSNVKLYLHADVPLLFVDATKAIAAGTELLAPYKWWH